MREQGRSRSPFFKTTSPATKIASLLTRIGPTEIRDPSPYHERAPMPASKSAAKIEELPHHPFHFIVLALASVLEDDLAALIDNVLRRPILVSIGVPRGVFIVLRDRIADAVALEGGLQIGQGFLEWKLGCMDADDDKALVPVSVVEPSDMW